MTAKAVLPSAKPSDLVEAFVMMETISTPGAISKVTSQLTAPSTSFVTFPFSTLRALIFMAGRIVPNRSRHRNSNVWIGGTVASPVHSAKHGETLSDHRPLAHGKKRGPSAVLRANNT